VIDREAVRSNANYLREVRPIDPDEICEYIEGQPHPAVVKQTLREEAFSLELVERDDGTFVPVDEEPADYRGWQPKAFPDGYSFALEDQLVRHRGANWHRGDSGCELRESISQLKEDYFAGAPVEYDQTAALGYAIYHLPDYYAAVGYVLDTLTERGLLDRTLRVLDVGAGSGGPALGLHDYLYGTPKPTASIPKPHSSTITPLSRVPPPTSLRRCWTRPPGTSGRRSTGRPSNRISATSQPRSSI